MPRPPVGGAGGYPPPRVLEIEFESILSGYLDHRLTQDVGINLGDEESCTGSGHRPVLWIILVMISMAMSESCRWNRAPQSEPKWLFIR